ncbi:MAG: hypothetical protein A2X59_12130 [Nitrospirae bacterium GWC2_42_7]|nr:MAG: hypothetical protein A2X59_12130 [Nitrospirae bacterium GWC2_42_7]
MSSVHDEIQELINIYLKGNESKEIKDKVESHLRECKECRDELAVISELRKVEVPDPGDLFWNTLPKKIRITAGEEKPGRFSFKKLFFSPLPFASVVMILMLLILSQTRNKNINEETFNDPLSASNMDYSDLNEEDIPLFVNNLLLDENYSLHEDISGNSYHSEFASLDAKELESFNDALKNEGLHGG